MSKLTLHDLRRIMREAAGEDADVDLDGDIIDMSFTELNYDSLALLEITVRVERAFGIKIGDDHIGEVTRPREFLDLVNARLTEAV